MTYVFFAIWLKIHFEPLFDKKQGIIDPEDRLPPGMVGAVFIPICLVRIILEGSEGGHINVRLTPLRF